MQDFFYYICGKSDYILKTYTMENLFLCYQRPYLKEIKVVVESGFVGSLENPTSTEDIEW